MIRVAFTVPGEPVAKGRAKFARRGNFVTTYTPEKTARYENLVKLAAEAAMAEHHLTLLEGPVELRVFAVRSIPASWSAKKRLAAAAGERQAAGCRPWLGRCGAARPAEGLTC